LGDEHVFLGYRTLLPEMSKRANREGTDPVILKGTVSDPATTNSRDSPLTLPEQEPTFHASQVPPGES